MTPVQRSIKRLLIILVYFFILCLIGYLFYLFFRKKPSCNDKIQNQGETGMDCGGPCTACEEIPQAQNLQITEKKIVSGEAGKYDLLVKIKNPNSQLGVSKFEYSFNLVDSAGKIIVQNPGSSFILPGQTKYILAFNLSPQENPDSLDFSISSFEWSKFTQFKEPDIIVNAKNFNLSGGGETGYANLEAKLKNQSGYDFHKISAYAVIRNGSGDPIALNQTNFNDVLSGEEREMHFNWNNSFPVNPVSAKVEIVPEVDVFENSNFLKATGESGKYDGFGAEIQK